MARSKIGFHVGPGGNKNGLGDWERVLNGAGQPFGMKAADEYGPLHEAVQVGQEHDIQNWLGFRFTKAAGRVSREVPNYDVAPWEDAPLLCQEVLDKLPPEFDKSVWLEIINEPRAENKGADTMFADMNACDYLGEWCLAASKYLNERGYRFMGPSFNAGEPGREGHPVQDAVTQYSQPGMLRYLRYCAENPEKAALSLHEYSWSRWKHGETAADWYPALWGRFQAAIAAADLNGIPRTFHIFVTEFGFAHNEAPTGSGGWSYLDARNRMTAGWPQLKYDAAWTLQSGWDSVDNHVNSWMQYNATQEFAEGEQPARTDAAFGATLPGAAPVEPEEPAQPGTGETDERQVIGTKEVTAPSGLNLRAGPTTDDTVIHKMPLGTVVEVVEEGEWDFIRVAGKEGYASSEWLSALAAVGATDPVTPVRAAGGFDAPVGTAEQRGGAVVWPKSWLDANPYLNHYTFGEPVQKAVHTGADLNLPADADADEPVYACAAGRVIYAQRVPGGSTWGNLVVIRHTLPGGQRVHSRYAHLKQIEVAKDEEVARGRQIGTIGGADVGLPNHLHFDISCSGILEGNPRHWPGEDEQAVRDHYVDPCQFIRDHRPAGAEPGEPGHPQQPDAIPSAPIGTKRVTADAGLRLREAANQNSSIIVTMTIGTEVEVLEEGEWDHVRLGNVEGYAFSRWLSPLTPLVPVAPGRTASGHVRFGMNINPDAPHGDPVDAGVLRGLGWVRFPFKLSARVNPNERDNIEAAFAQYDPIVHKYAQQEVNTLLVLNQETVAGKVPWQLTHNDVVVHPYSDNTAEWEEYAGRFAHVAGRIAAHYRDAGLGQRVAYQIWNEGDMQNNPASAYLKPEHMAIVLRRAEEAIHREVPEAMLIFNGMATGAEETVRYLQQCRQALGGRLPVEAIGIHPYGRYVSGPVFPNWGFGPLSDPFAIYRRNFPGMRFWITEIGIAEDKELGPEHYPAIGNYMRDVCTHVARDYSDVIDVLIWFAWSDEMRNAGMVTRAGQPKQHVYAVFEQVRDRLLL